MFESFHWTDAVRPASEHVRQIVAYGKCLSAGIACHPTRRSWRSRDSLVPRGETMGPPDRFVIERGIYRLLAVVVSGMIFRQYIGKQNCKKTSAAKRLKVLIPINCAFKNINRG